MKDYIQLRIQVFLIAVLLLALYIIVFSRMPAKAANDISVCRDDTYPTLRFEFHNIPNAWFTYGSDVSWGYWAGGVEMQPGLLIADALIEDTDGYLAGTATVNDYDNSLSWQGDAQTAACGVSTPALLETPQNTYQIANNALPVVQAVVSTGVVCVVKYPEAVVVCNG